MAGNLSRQIACIEPVAPAHREKTIMFIGGVAVVEPQARGPGMQALLEAEDEAFSEDDEVEAMSFRQRLNKATELQAASARSTEAGALAAASADLKEALRFLRDVDEDSPREAQHLRTTILAASKRLFDQCAKGAEGKMGPKDEKMSAAQAAHAISHAAGGNESGKVDPCVLENLALCLHGAEGARDFCDAGGLLPLLQLCSRREDSCSSRALEAVLALSSIIFMVPALCSAGAQASARGNCLWWLRESLHTGTGAALDHLRGLNVMRNMSDTKDLDGKQLATVQCALRHAMTEAGESGEENMIALLHTLLTSAITSADAPDEPLALLLCTCIRNLARDAQLRAHLAPLLPLLVTVCFLSTPPASARAAGAGV